MKKNIILITIVLVLSFVLASFVYQTHAQGLDSMGNPNSYIRQDGDSDNAMALGIANLVVGIIRRVGEAISIVMLMIIGIKYVLGSVEDKAEYKQTMWPYVLGAILIFAGAEFTNIIYMMMNG